MLYLGQVCKHHTKEQFTPLIFLGFDGDDFGHFAIRKGDTTDIETFPIKDIAYIRTEFKDSPSGFRILYGDNCKFIYSSDIQLAVTDKMTTELTTLIVTGKLRCL